ncbi:MAG: universal stress protein [Acidimicrobiia bacterium]
MPKTVLVPLDGSTAAMRAIAIATVLADRFDADVRLIAAQVPGGGTRTDWLDDAVAHTHSQGARAEAVWSISVADAVRALADDANDPIVCMATHARTRLGHALFGSVAEDVVRSLAIPAVLVGPKCRESWPADGPLLVCLDGSKASDTIIPIAREWAVALGTKVVLLHVFHPLDVESATRPEAVLGPAAERLAADVDVEMRVVRGRHPARTIIELIEEVEPSLVALATHGRTGLARVALGSIATEVVRRSVCPALVVRPPTLAED